MTSAIYTHDAADRKSAETVTYPGFALTNTYAYHKNGLTQTFTGPDGITHSYLYDSNNQLAGVRIPNVGMFTVNGYDWTRPSTETLPGGGRRDYQYDPLMRRTRITALDAGGNQVLNRDYTYDKMANITRKGTEHGDYGYGYDNLYRLTTADNPDGADESYTYDAVGNRKSSADTAGEWSYNANNELEGCDDTAFRYDANGNLIEKSVNGVVTRFFYNLENRLERVEDNAGNTIAAYYYDPFGRRLWKETAQGRTCFHYSEQGLIGEYDAAGGPVKGYGWKPGSTWSTDPLYMKIGSQYYWYHNDHLGTPQKLVTNSGNTVWRATYTSFGKATVDPGSAVDNPLRFAGQYYDSETGLHYNYHRYYDPKLGRYLRTDPIGIQKGKNHLYVYTNSNPINAIDPKGWCKWSGVFSILGVSNGVGGGATGILNIKSECCNGKEAGGEYVWTAAGAMPGPSVISGSFSEVELSGPSTPSKSDPVGLFHYISASAAIVAGPGWSHIYSGSLEGKGFSWVFG